GFLLNEQLPRGGVEAEPIVTSYKGIAFLQAADRLIDLLLRNPFLGDSLLQPTQVGQEPVLLLLAHRLILGLAALASAQHVELTGGFEPFDPNPRLLLRRVVRRGL